MGIAAHDLRSPLNAIKGYSEMVLEAGRRVGRSFHCSVLGMFQRSTECARVFRLTGNGKTYASESIRHIDSDSAVPQIILPPGFGLSASLHFVLSVCESIALPFAPTL